jgi:trans-2,3-dihydro-3-hydroxyanthranilate isomerase
MGGRTFYIVDVFAEEKYAGNQLAVFNDVKRLSLNEMQRIAKEMNYSETTFILSEKIRGRRAKLRFAAVEHFPHVIKYPAEPIAGCV